MKLVHRGKSNALAFLAGILTIAFRVKHLYFVPFSCYIQNTIIAEQNTLILDHIEALG